MGKIIKKADIYFKNEIELRVCVPLEGNIEDNFCQISHAVEKYGQGLKLESIYFREEEIKE